MAAEDYRISKEIGAAYTKAWRDSNPLEDLKGFSLSREAIDAILATDGVDKLKIYFGKKDGKVALVYVGADEEFNDILTNNAGESNIYDVASPCPTDCGDGNGLNGDL